MTPLFGYHMPSFSFSDVLPEGLFDHVRKLAEAADRAGFDVLTVMDHFYQIRGNGPETEPMMEAYTTLAALAAHTSTIRLGTLVTGVTYRNPALLAKTVTTLDVISHGRALLGIGAAWNDSEHAGYGFTFPAVRERMDRLDEALTIARRMFTEERPSFAGRYYQIDRALNVPRPLQPGGPRILVGGAGERRTLRLAAQHADMTHWFISSLDEFKHKQAVLDEHCRELGRDPASIVRTIGAPVALGVDERHAQSMAQAGRFGATPAGPEQAADILREFVRAGAGGFFFRNVSLATPELLATAGQVKRYLA